MDSSAPVAKDRHFGEQGRRLSYGSYLALPELLSLQRSRTGAHDELLFIVIHQVYELWFKQLLHELGAARDHMAGGDVASAQHELRRVTEIERVLIAQVAVLETMSPQDFLAFRADLAPASGFQSVQFREIEFLSGLPDPAYLERVEANTDEAVRLRRRLEEPTLWDAFVVLCNQRGVTDLVEILDDRARFGDLFSLSESLLDHDEAFALWRMRHLLMVERMIGSKSGTGGSTGSSYLRTTLDKRCFPDLWALRNRL